MVTQTQPSFIQDRPHRESNPDLNCNKDSIRFQTGKDSLFCKVCGHKWIKQSRKKTSEKGRLRCPSCYSHSFDKGENIPCELCHRLVMVPFIHHIDGNHLNNLSENRMAVCFDCHSAIHNGISSRRTSSGKCRRKRARCYIHDSELLLKINQLRQKWLESAI